MLVVKKDWAVIGGVKCRIAEASYTYTPEFYIRGSVHRNSRLKISNEMQQYTVI